MNRKPAIRIVSAVVAALCTGLILYGAIAYGLDSINVITLAEHPMRIWLYALGPAIGLVLAASLFLFRAWVFVNLVELIVLIVVIEVVFGRMIPASPQVEGDPVSLRAVDYLKSDPRVGYVLEPDDEARHVRTVDGKVDYDVRYVIDSLGRRRIEAPHPANAERCLLFFGDSNTFGEGLPQGATLPDEMQRRWPDAAAYNYGVHGYGIAQMLDVIASRDLPREVPERRGIAFYYFISAHMPRLVGSSNISTSWGRRLSYYRLENGRAVWHGDFATGRRMLTLFYGLLQRSNVVSYYGMTFPRRYTAADYELAGALVAESRERLRQQFQLDDFYFVLSPAVGETQAATSATIAAVMQGRGIHVIDLTKALDLTERRYRVADDDYHQSAEANRLLAEKLSEQVAHDHPDMQSGQVR